MGKFKNFRWELLIIPIVLASMVYLLTSYLIVGPQRDIGQNSFSLRFLFLGVSLITLACLDMQTRTVYQGELTYLISGISFLGGLLLIMVFSIGKIGDTSIFRVLHFVKITDIMEITAILFLLSSLFLFFKVLNKSKVAEDEIMVVDRIAWYPNEVFSLNPIFRHEIIKLEKENWVDSIAKLKFKDGGEYEVELGAVAILEIQRANYKQPFLSGTNSLKENLKMKLEAWLAGVVQRQAREMTLGEFFAIEQLQPAETMIYDLPFTWSGELSRTISS